MSTCKLKINVNLPQLFYISSTLRHKMANLSDLKSFALTVAGRLLRLQADEDEERNNQDKTGLFILSITQLVD